MYMLLIINLKVNILINLLCFFYIFWNDFIYEL